MHLVWYNNHIIYIPNAMMGNMEAIVTLQRAVGEGARTGERQ